MHLLEPCFRRFGNRFLATEIGKPIPNDVNIFVDDITKLPRSIDEAAIFVCELLKKQEEAEVEATAA